MAITIERCPHCGTPYMSALLPGESPAARMCDNCNRRAGDPKDGAAAPPPKANAPALSPIDEDLMLQPVLDDAPLAAAATTHRAPNARDQIVGQIKSNAGPAIPGLPSDAPMYEGPPKPPLMTVASGIRLAILLVVLVVVAKFVYGVYQRTFDAPITPTAPAAATPTVAELTKPPPSSATPATPVAPAAAPAKVPEKKPVVAAADASKTATPPAKPKELATEGGMSDNNDVKSPPKSGPGGDVNNLLSTDSRKRARTNDDEDPDPAKPVVKTPPPPQQPGSKPVPPAKKGEAEQKDPMVALLEKNKGNANPPTSNNPDLPPGANPNAPGQPGGPTAPPGQPAQNPKPKGSLPDGPITASVPQVVPPPPNAFNGVTFLMNYQGWLCKDFDDAHSLRESFFYNRDNVIMLTAMGRTSAKLIALVEIPKSAAGKKPELVLEVTNKDAVHSWMLHATIEGADALRQTEIKTSDPKKPWQEIHIDLSNFTDRRFYIQLEVLPPTAKDALPLDHAGYIRNPHLNWQK